MVQPAVRDPMGQVIEERADGDEQPRKVYLGLIDIWQDWSLAKKIERCLLLSSLTIRKSLKRTKNKQEFPIED